ncbi:GNAT family N-acetyltransferase [Nocardioides sp. Soil805]|uniref:GNAT family N-acetyltransferase n=1 Tax=Nocardioides sp. Soil805 TaxID=1736416 RepID=UPI000ADF08AC|nr:GNAT family N-acetyltransferase [Nocardioides sp. Soil805]
MAETTPSPTRLPTLTTERLVLRPVTVDDLDLMGELNGDPAVMTFIRGRPATSDETADEWRQRLQRQSDPARGLGYWAGFEGPSFVGWWSASSFEGRSDVSGVGYRLTSESWGRGLATEGARMMVHQAFACDEVERVLASTMAANAGSRRVLEKLGMTHTSSWAAEGKERVPGWEEGEVGYEFGRAEWQVR